MGDRDLGDVTETLRELSRKQLVRAARRSSIEGEAEYAFWHILARDVAYAQLPRSSRSSRHVAAARWIESKAPERVEDLADVLSYHYATALDLARAAGEEEQALELEALALRFLSLAGERALGLDTSAAVANLERALALAPVGRPERPQALARFGEAALQAGRITDAAEALEEAIALCKEEGDRAGAARAISTLGRTLIHLGDPRWTALPTDALALLEPLPRGAEYAAMLVELSRVDAMTGQHEAAIRHAERALSIGHELGLDRSSRALGFRGMGRAQLGDPRGLDDYREAIAIATEAGQGREVALLHNNLGMDLWALEGPAAAVKVMKDGIAFARARGLEEAVWTTASSSLDPLVDVGAFDEAIGLAEDLATRLSSDDVFDLTVVRAVEVRVAAFRGRASSLSGALDALAQAARGTEDAQLAIVGLGSSAIACAQIGRGETATALLEEMDATPALRQFAYYAVFLPALARTALDLRDPRLAQRLTDGLEPRHPYASHALAAAHAGLLEFRGDQEEAAEAYADAADRWERFGVVPERAFALLGQGRSLIGCSRASEATPVLQRAREIFERLEAAPALAETDALLRQATT